MSTLWSLCCGSLLCLVGGCWCGDTTCNDVCKGTVHNFEMHDGFCPYVAAHPAMTDQEKCCACPQWGCVVRWLNGDTENCDGGLDGTCDLSCCGREECWELSLPALGCTSHSDPGKTFQQCAELCRSWNGCDGFEYMPHSGCSLCTNAATSDQTSDGPVWRRSGRRLDGYGGNMETTTLAPTPSICFKTSVCDYALTSGAFRGAATSLMLIILWLIGNPEGIFQMGRTSCGSRDQESLPRNTLRRNDILGMTSSI